MLCAPRGLGIHDEAEHRHGGEEGKSQVALFGAQLQKRIVRHFRAPVDYVVEVVSAVVRYPIIIPYAEERMMVHHYSGLGPVVQSGVGRYIVSGSTESRDKAVRYKEVSDEGEDGDSYDCFDFLIA